MPARLHVLLASRAPVGVIFRRGPSHQVCTIGWNREDDTFQLGQWLDGKIYPLRSDLSPDGRHMIYFAGNFRALDRTKGTWTAISRAPWLKAVVLHGKGGTWCGGGLFRSNCDYWLNESPHTVHDAHFLLEDAPGLYLADKKPPEYGLEDTGVYYPRLQRDGWTKGEYLKGENRHEACQIFHKALPGGWVLQKLAHQGIWRDKPCYWDEHELEHSGRNVVIRKPEWEWAERDGDTVVWAEAGCLFSGTLGRDGLESMKRLGAFNGMKFERRVAPY